MLDGAVVALVSDAGMPLVSDPGYVLVAGCIAAGLEVEVLPGPSAAIAALVASGLPADRWRFAGFLPRGASAIVAELDAGGAESLVAFESPRRLRKTLATIASADPARPLAVCRELTKDHEEVVRGTAAEVAQHFEEHEPLGEIVLVIGAPEAAGADLGPALAALGRLVETGAKPRAAAAVVAELTGVAKNALYEAWLEKR
jgi:16S rRNA (cytidine1402-2'-O)-methyltransferase